MLLSDKAESVSSAVYHCKPNFGYIGNEEIEELKQLMLSTQQTARICLHSSTKDNTHVSVICTSNKFKNRKHYHPNKCEYIIPIEGKARLQVFENDSLITSTLLDGNLPMATKISEKSIHNFEIESEFFLFWEICEGPFQVDSTIYVE